MSGNKSKKEANELLEQLYDSTQADSGTVIVVGGPARDASGTVTRHMRELRDLLSQNARSGLASANFRAKMAAACGRV